MSVPSCLLIPISILLLATSSQGSDDAAVSTSWTPITTLVTDNTELSVQSTLVDRIVDAMISEFRQRIEQDSDGKIKLSDVIENCGMIGEIKATDGVFSNLTTLTRIGEAEMPFINSNVRKLVLSSTFGLSIAKMHYKHYMLRFLLVAVEGDLSIDINGGEVKALVSGDFSKHPCRLILRKLDIVRVGKINVQITGLGILNNISSRIVSWIAETWKKDVIENFHGVAEDMIQKVLSKFDCKNNSPFS